MRGRSLCIFCHDCSVCGDGRVHNPDQTENNGPVPIKGLKLRTKTVNALEPRHICNVAKMNDRLTKRGSSSVVKRVYFVLTLFTLTVVRMAGKCETHGMFTCRPPWQPLLG